MIINSLEISKFRNLHRVSLKCSPSLNLIFGDNASGKTSLLEALYFLGRGRSFRTRQIRTLIHHGEPEFRIVATVAETTSGRHIPVGIQRSLREIIARIDGKSVQTLAQLAVQIPVLLLNPGSHLLIEGGPQQRRRFMDWGLFHTEQTFLTAWKRYVYALRNRNAALRANSSHRVVDAWDKELITSSRTLDLLRKTFCEALQGVLEALVEVTLGILPLRVEYRRGWPQEQNQDLIAVLHAGRDQDRKQGYTRLGPHRADFQIELAGRPAQEHLSRGQQKLLVTALVLAQARLYEKRKGNPCILLIDDLPAELDQTHREKVLSCLAEMNTQLFITTIEENLMDISKWHHACRYKIAHGDIRKMI